MNIYQPFANFLIRKEESMVRLTFSQIEEILEFRLPPSARRHRAWWANSRTNDTHSWAHLWIAAGWVCRERDLSQETVVFERVGFILDESSALEGYEMDHKVLRKARHKGLADKCKRRDAYTYLACGFCLEVGGRYVVEAHHLNLISDQDARITSLEELVSLCPTCHRLAHLRNPPFELREIAVLRSSVEKPEALDPS